jgi:UDP-N-acetylmuramoylalanine--D-glutamate ligase
MIGRTDGKNALVLGLGESGLAMARWCGLHGCRVRVADTREAPATCRAAPELPEAEFVAGPFGAALLDRRGLRGRQPGLSPLEATLAR